MSLDGATDTDKLISLGNKTYKEQAVWFLNAFWRAFGEQEAERVWNNAHLMAQLDTAKKMQGNALDEFMAHHFLEKNNETLTVQQMRENLRQVGIEKVKLVPFIHYLIFRYKADWHKLVNAPQGNQEEIAKAQRMFDEVQSAFAQAQRREEEARKDEEDSKKAAEDAENAAEAARAAQRELEAALAALQEQEQAYKQKTEELTRKTEEGGVVQRNKAKNELAQHLAEDPLPLRRAKITTEAATKKAERAANAAADAAAAAKVAAAKAEEARGVAEEAVAEAQRKVAEAEEYLNEVKNNPGGEGSVWWIDRELHEAKAYMPVSKGGYAKKAVLPK